MFSSKEAKGFRELIQLYRKEILYNIQKERVILNRSLLKTTYFQKCYLKCDQAPLILEYTSKLVKRLVDLCYFRFVFHKTGVLIVLGYQVSFQLESQQFVFSEHVVREKERKVSSKIQTNTYKIERKRDHSSNTFTLGTTPLQKVSLRCTNSIY